MKTRLLGKFKRMEKKIKIPGVRRLFAVVAFLGLVTNYALRVNINVAIVAMVNSSAVNSNGNKSISNDCGTGVDTFTKKKVVEKEGEFDWSPKTQGIILGSYYYGYCCFQIIAGRLSEKYSGKWVFAIGTFIASLLGLITPTAARHSANALVFVRSLQGLSHGVMVPAMYSMIGRWMPDMERGVFSAIMHSGMNIGIMVGMTGSGFLCNSNFLNGWPSVFYIFGLINILWIMLWCLLVTDSPLEHPFITQAELKYIISNQEIDIRKKIPPIPWLKVFTSVPVWALLFTQAGMDWCLYIMLNELPTFFATVLHINIEKNGFLSSVPFFLKAITGSLVGFITDTLIRKRLVTVNLVRKFCTAVASLSPAVGLIAVCFAGCDVTLCVAFLMCSLPALGFAYSGFSICHLNLSPEYAGTLMGITNSFASLMGFFAPMFVGFLTEEHQSILEWHTVFETTIFLLIFSCIVFVLFGSTKKQNWIAADSERSVLVPSPGHYEAD